MLKMLVMLMVVGMLGVISGCATVMNTPYQNVPVTSSPLGAVVIASSSGHKIITPGSFRLRRNVSTVLTAELDGYGTMTKTLKPSIWNFWGLCGNVLVGGIPGIVVDGITGSSMVLIPKEVHFNFECPSRMCKCIENTKTTTGEFIKGSFYRCKIIETNYYVYIKADVSMIIEKDLFEEHFKLAGE